MLPGLAAGLILLQPEPTALFVAERACIASGGDFEAFEQAGGAMGVPVSEAEIQAIFPTPPRGVGRVSGYRIGDIRVVLIDLPAGRRNVSAPIQTAGEPVRMWDFDFPHSVVCRVQAPSLPEGWVSAIDAWVIENAPLRPRVTGQGFQRSWTFGSGGFVNAQAADDLMSRIDIVYRSTP
ncbi:MAG: hypothetical protein KJ916_06415 [Alphaproteobacteria bacterium]|nr:hypothetical protein [Alphaproteobacteria bacterium]MBU2378066.1 hypothetical protein [Alphaproteobacteria bacterium]